MKVRKKQGWAVLSYGEFLEKSGLTCPVLRRNSKKNRLICPVLSRNWEKKFGWPVLSWIEVLRNKFGWPVLSCDEFLKNFDQSCPVLQRNLKKNWADLSCPAAKLRKYWSELSCPRLKIWKKTRLTCPVVQWSLKHKWAELSCPVARLRKNLGWPVLS